MAQWIPNMDRYVCNKYLVTGYEGEGHETAMFNVYAFCRRQGAPGEKCVHEKRRR